ncbi:MAG TPA: hypothetical protein DEH78_24355, partial [Solibacterales bacterium]|nr:hypothetical protein [Bryobacterales bacterium]
LTALALALGAALMWVWNRSAPGDIAAALTSNPELYTLSLGHAADLTVDALAYLKLPLGLAAFAFLIGAAASWRYRGPALAIALAVMMALFFQAARIALIAFDPYLGSRPLAEALLRAPQGGLILDNQYYAFSSVIFYTNRRALLLNGRVNNLEYGSYAPGAPDVFIDDEKLSRLWHGPQRWYLCVEGPRLPRLERHLGSTSMHIVAKAGGKYVLSNRPPRARTRGDTLDPFPAARSQAPPPGGSTAP